LPTRPPVSDVPDAAIVGEALTGSQAAYRELVRRYQGPVLNLIVQMVRDRSEAEDLTQEVFVKAFSRLRTYDTTRRFGSWMFKIAHNHTIDHLRRVRPETLSLSAGNHPELPAAAMASPQQLAERTALADDLDAAVQRLRVEYRSVIQLRYQEDLPQEEIAEILGVPEGTVKTYLHRARKELAEAMAARGWKA
jgi:RNA polymerase sigma-70 factor (ECF subfamily)